jgi:hypothetical protein
MLGFPVHDDRSARRHRRSGTRLDHAGNVDEPTPDEVLRPRP